MFQDLRKRFILTAMLSVAIVLAAILTFIDVLYGLSQNSSADQVLKFLAANNGRFPENSYDNPFSEETPYSTRFFTVNINNKDGVVSINMGHVAAIQPSEAYNYALMVVDSGHKTGYFKDYKYLVTTTQTGHQIIFLDRKQELDSLLYLVFLSIIIFVLGLSVIFVLLWFLSKPIIEPVIENIRKQREFIANASHEIKTPLSIISADTDVIEIEHGKDEWTRSIKEQIVRLNELIKSLLTLSKMDAVMPKEISTHFDIAEVVQNTAEDFRPVATNEDINFSVNMPDNPVPFDGNIEGVEQLTSVLLNNAFKYTPKDGVINLRLSKKGRGVILDVTNTTDQMPKGDLKRLFERFYRDDSSRSRQTGSYGIGLSIAQAITKQHKGHISAKKLGDRTILFRAVLNPNG